MGLFIENEFCIQCAKRFTFTHLFPDPPNLYTNPTQISLYHLSINLSKFLGVLFPVIFEQIQYFDLNEPTRSHPLDREEYLKGFHNSDEQCQPVRFPTSQWLHIKFSHSFNCIIKTFTGVKDAITASILNILPIKSISYQEKWKVFLLYLVLDIMF